MSYVLNGSSIPHTSVTYNVALSFIQLLKCSEAIFIAIENGKYIDVLTHLFIHSLDFHSGLSVVAWLRENHNLIDLLIDNIHIFIHDLLIDMIAIVV